MFTRAAVSVLVAVIGLAGCQKPTSNAADKVFIGGTIYTADGSQSVVSAMAIGGDQILALGTDSSVAALIGKQTEVIDLQGKMIIPGLHDVHIHLPGIVETDSCDLASTPYSLEDLVPRLKPCLDGLEAGEWLSVDQWSYTSGNEPSEALPTVRAALDAVSTQHPIMLLGNDGHHGAVNSYALSLATDKYGNQVGLSAATLAKEFSDYSATVGVDANGEPNGALNEDARKLVNIPNLWGYPTIDKQLVSRIGDKLAANGITSVLDAALTSKDIVGFARAAKDTPLTYRMSAAFYADFEDYRPDPDAAIDIDAVVADIQQLQAAHQGIANFKLDTAKIFIDGVTEGNPYAQPPTLPNAASLNNYLQPVFGRDAKTGAIAVQSYVDTDSAACALGRSLSSAADKQAFYQEHGFLAAQCIQSNGVLEKEPEFLHDYTLALFAAGINVHSHAIGDRAVRFALDAFEAARKASPDSSANLSMAHAQFIDPGDIGRYAELDVYPTFTYGWIEPDVGYLMTVSPFLDHIKSVEELFDPDDYGFRNSYPAGSIAAVGGVLTAGSDAPVDTREPRPFFNLEKAVTRQQDETGRVYNPAEKISLTDALDAYTINGAKMLQNEQITGSLEAGKKADFVILDTDLLALDAAGNAHQISDTQVLSTWFDGRKIYSAIADQQ
ncbi:MAG: amidohydrolase [Porticoccaceae bacterium]